VTGAAITLVVGTKVSLFDAFIYFNAYLGFPLSIPLFMGMIMRKVPAWAGWTTVLFGMGLAVFCYDFMPTATGRAFLEPRLGHTAYTYAITNKFVITNLVAVPLSMLFFWITHFFHRSHLDGKHEDDVREFFRRMDTPVNFETEVGHDNTAD